MTERVIGFALNARLCTVPMILEQTGPSSIDNQWNGISGTVQQDETLGDAMSRIYKQVTGNSGSQWSSIGTLYGLDTVTHIFRGVDQDIIKDTADTGNPLGNVTLHSILVSGNRLNLGANVATMVQHALTGTGLLTLTEQGEV